MRTVFKIKGVNYRTKIRYVLAIDPGYNHMGIALTDIKSKKTTCYKFDTDMKPMCMNYPELFLSSETITDQLLNLLPKDIKYENLQLIIEQTIFQLEFAVGIFTLITNLLHKLLFYKKINSIILLNPGTTGQYTGERSTSDGLKVKFARDYITFVKIHNGEYMTPHMADALFFTVFIHYDFFKNNFDIKLPKIDYITKTYDNLITKESKQLWL